MTCKHCGQPIRAVVITGVTTWTHDREPSASSGFWGPGTQPCLDGINMAWPEGKPRYGRGEDDDDYL